MEQYQSYWIASTPETHYSSLPIESHIDVAVIGGGIVGITTAYLLKQLGYKVAVVEAKKIVHDVTGHTTAKITAAHGILYKYLIDTFGKEKAKYYADAQQLAIDEIAGLVKHHKIDCDFERKKAYIYTQDEKNVTTIEEEITAALSVGLPVSFTKKTSLPFPIKAAIQYENQAQFHPRKYLLGLAEHIQGEGSCIAEHTRALDIQEGDPCKISTDKGVIYSKKVIIATHFPFYDRAFYFSRLSPYTSYVVAVTTSDSLKGMYYSMDQSAHSFRTQPYGKGELILIGGEGHKAGQGGDITERYRKLETYVREIYPIKDIKYEWSTQDNETLDRVPYIGKDTPTSKHIYVATGFGGWGMTNGTVAALLLCDLIQEKKNEWEELFSPSRFKPVVSVKKAVTEGLNIGKQYVKGILDSHKNENIHSLQNGEGTVVKSNGEKLAVYKDKKGNVCALSAVCTHMGCIVNFNNAEKTWDCPCHGSRFDLHGKVIHGPATKDLEEK